MFEQRRVERNMIILLLQLRLKSARNNTSFFVVGKDQMCLREILRKISNRYKNAKLQNCKNITKKKDPETNIYTKQTNEKKIVSFNCLFYFLVPISLAIKDCDRSLRWFSISALVSYLDPYQVLELSPRSDMGVSSRFNGRYVKFHVINLKNVPCQCIICHIFSSTGNMSQQGIRPHLLCLEEKTICRIYRNIYIHKWIGICCKIYIILWKKTQTFEMST